MFEKTYILLVMFFLTVHFSLKLKIFIINILPCSICDDYYFELFFDRFVGIGV